MSLSLCDIAIECSLTSGGNHQQVYVLVPAKLSKPGARYINFDTVCVLCMLNPNTVVGLLLK